MGRVTVPEVVAHPSIDSLRVSVDSRAPSATMTEHPGHVLFVCTANTCRSPMAAALLRHALAAEAEPLKSLPVISAGVSAMSGYPAAANAVQALRKVGILLADHRSQRVTQEMLNQALAVFCMTESHRAMLEMDFDPLPQHLHLMRELMPGMEPDIPDPFGMNLSAYEASRDSMVEAIPSLVAFLRTLVIEPAAEPGPGEG